MQLKIHETIEQRPRPANPKCQLSRTRGVIFNKHNPITYGGRISQTNGERLVKSVLTGKKLT